MVNIDLGIMPWSADSSEHIDVKVYDVMMHTCIYKPVLVRLTC